MGTGRLWWGGMDPMAGIWDTQLGRAEGGAPTYIAHVDGTLVSLHLLLGCQ